MDESTDLVANGMSLLLAVISLMLAGVSTTISSVARLQGDCSVESIEKERILSISTAMQTRWMELHLKTSRQHVGTQNNRCHYCL